MSEQSGASYPIYIRGCGDPTTRVQGGKPIPVHIIGSDVDVTDQEVENLIASGMVRQGDTWHAFGGFQDADETITIAAVDTWAHVTNGTNDLWTGLEADGMTLSGDVMTIINTGDYTGSLSMTISALNGKDYQIRVYNITQTAQMGYEIGATTTGVNNFANITLPLYLEVNAGDQLRMEIRCTTDSTNVVVRSSVFTLAYLHD